MKHFDRIICATILICIVLEATSSLPLWVLAIRSVIAGLLVECIITSILKELK